MLALVVTFVLCSPQQPVVVEVVGPAAVPSDALREQLKKGEDEFILFDVAYGVRETVVHLHEEWGSIEHDRMQGLLALTAAMHDSAASGTGAEAGAVRDVAAVACALLDVVDEYGELSAAQRAEVAEVKGAGNGTMRFLPQQKPCDWRAAEPRGGYANAWLGELGGLFRATVYLRAYLAHWPAATVEAWLAAARAANTGDTARELDLVDRAMPILFGASAAAPGLPAPAVAADLVWLHANARAGGAAHEKLAALFAAMPMREPKAMSDGVVRLAHELAVARATDPLFGAMAPEQWHAKWRDSAAFAYVGLREVDCLMRAVGREHLRLVPRIVVEPLPGVWEALRWLERRRNDLDTIRSPEFEWGKEGTWVDPVLEALAHQQRGEDLPAKLHERLLHMLMWDFEAPDLLIGTESDIEGVTGRVRRADPQLVRVPIVWRGQTKKALALRLFVEEQRADGTWHGPPSAAPQAK